MSFRMTSIYPYRVWVASVSRWRIRLTNAETADAVGTAKGSAGCGGSHDHAGHGHHHDHHADGKARVRDPVCGMTVDPATSKHRFDDRGETFHFCSAGCRTKFAADPQKYLDKSQRHS